MFNEAGNLKLLPVEIRRSLPDGIGFEGIIVDNSGIDATASIIRDSMSRLPAAVKQVRHERDCGQSIAFLSGVQPAEGEWTVTLDGNGGHDIHVPVNHRPRLHGESKYWVRNRLWVVIIGLLGILWLDHLTWSPNRTS